MAQPLDELLAKFTPQHSLDHDSLMFAAGQQSRSANGWKLAVAGLCVSQIITLGILAVVLVGEGETKSAPPPTGITHIPPDWPALQANDWPPLEVSPAPEPQGYPQPYSTTPMISDDPPLLAGSLFAKQLDQ